MYTTDKFATRQVPFNFVKGDFTDLKKGSINNVKSLKTELTEKKTERIIFVFIFKFKQQIYRRTITLYNKDKTSQLPIFKIKK